MPYIGNSHIAGDHTNNFKVLDDISSHTATFDGSATSVVDTTNNTIRVPEHRFVQGQRVLYHHGGGGSNIGGLGNNTPYFIIFDTAHTIKLATTLANANSNTVINLSAVGSGTSHTLNAAFDGVNTKFKMTHGSGKSARLNNATQLNVAINNVIQRPNLDPNNFTDGFAIQDNHKIVFKTAPTVNDVFWGSIIANTIENFDLRDNEVDNFTGDGSTTEFTLSTIPANNESVIVSINGVVQHPSDKNTARSYTLIDSIIQFTAAPALGDGIQVRHIGFAGASTNDVSGFYGRTGNVALTSSDHITTGDITPRNINASGIITASSFDGSFSSNVGGSNANFTGIVTAGVFKSGDFDGRNLNISGITTFAGDVSIGGTLTYEDVTNIDSIGIVTARDGLKVLAGGANVVGVVTASGADINGDLDVDGHTNLDNVSIAGVTTISNNLTVTSTAPQIFLTDTNANSDYAIVVNTGQFRIRDETNGQNRFAVNSDGHSDFYGRLDANSGLEVTQNATFNNDIDVDGHTNLDNVSIAGITTFTVGTNKSVQIYAATHNDESQLGAGIGFSRQSDGVTPLSGIFGHSNTGLGVAARDHITFLTGGTSLVNDTEERVRIDSAGRVGIGTDTLDSSADLSITNTGSARIYMKSGNSSDCSIYFGALDDAVTGGIRYDHSDDSLRFYGYNNSEKIRIASNGRIGIGTDTDLTATVSLHGFTNPNAVTIKFSNTNSSDGFIQYFNGAMYIKAAATTGDKLMQFQTAGSARLTIDGNGHIATQNLGSYSFNNDTANAKVFEVTGDGTAGEYGVINISGNQNANNANIGNIRFVNRENSATNSGGSANSRAIAGIQVYSVTSDSNAGDDCGGYMQFITKPEGSGTSSAMIIDSSGNVVIGHTSANAKLHIASGTSSAVGDATNPALQIGSTANYRFAVHTTNEQAIIGNKNGDDGIAFHTKTASSGSFGEALRITSGGTVNIGGDYTSTTSRLRINSTSYPETTEYLAVFKAGVANGNRFKNRYIKIRNNYTGSAHGGVPIVWETNADGSNNKAYGAVVTEYDGSIRFLNAAATSEKAIGTDLLGTIGEKLRIRYDGNVGINETSPQEKLQIAGNISLGNRGDNTSRYIGKGTNGSGGVIGDSSANANSSWIGFISGSGTGQEDQLRFATHKSGVSGGERMRIDGEGIVKIKEKLVILNGGGFSETAPQGLSIRNAGIYLEQGNDITWNNGDNSISGESGYHLSFKTYNGSSNTEKLQISGGSGNAGNWLKTSQSGALFAYDVKSNNSSTCRPAAGDWVYVGDLGYGSNMHGKFVVEWTNISSPGCCHHGYVILEAGTSYGAGYDYDWSESLKVLHFDAHNSDHFKAWKMVDHGNVLKVFGQWNGGTVASGTFYVTALTGDTYLGSCFLPATPVVDNNSYDGTRLTIDGTFQRGATGLNPSTKRMQGGSYYGLLHTYGGLDTYGTLSTRGTGAGNGYFGTIWCNYGGISGSGKQAGSFTPYAGQVCPAGSGNRYIHVKLNITGGSMWMVEIMGYEYNGNWTSTVNGVSVTSDKIHHSISGGYYYNNNALFNGKAKAYRGNTPGWYISGGYICCYIDTSATGLTNRHGFYKFAGGVDWIIGRSAQKPTNIIAYSYSGSTSDQF